LRPRRIILGGRVLLRSRRQAFPELCQMQQLRLFLRAPRPAGFLDADLYVLEQLCPVHNPSQIAPLRRTRMIQENCCG